MHLEGQNSVDLMPEVFRDCRPWLRCRSACWKKVQLKVIDRARRGKIWAQDLLLDSVILGRCQRSDIVLVGVTYRVEPIRLDDCIGRFGHVNCFLSQRYDVGCDREVQQGMKCWNLLYQRIGRYRTT